MLLLFSSVVYAKNQPFIVNDEVKSEQEIEQLIQQYLKPKAVLNAYYDEFKFSSRKGNFFNQYSGHTNLTSVGGDNFKLYNYYWRFNAYNITTNSNATYTHSVRGSTFSDNFVGINFEFSGMS